MSFQTPLIIYNRSEYNFYLKFVDDEDEIVAESDHLDFSNEEIYEYILDHPQKVLEVLNQMQAEKKICDSLVGGYTSLGGVCFFLGEEAYEEELIKRLKI